MNSPTYRRAACHDEPCAREGQEGEPCWGQVEWEDDIVYDDDSEPIFACRGHAGFSVGDPYKPEDRVRV